MDQIKLKITNYLASSSNQAKIIPIVVLLIVIEIGVLAVMKKDLIFGTPESTISSQNSTQVINEEDDEEEEADDVIDIEDLGGID